MESSETENPFYPWLIVAILWVVAFLNYFDRILITSMRDPIVNEFRLNDAQFGLLTSAFLWSYGLLSPLGGYFADKYGRKAVIVFSVGIWSATTIWTGFVSSFHEMLFARIVMGVSEACYIPAALALITDYHKGRTRSLATGLHMSGLYTGLALGGLGGFIAELWGWRSGFRVFGLFGIFYAVILLFVLRDKGRNVEGSTSTVKFPNSENRGNLIASFKLLFSYPAFRILLFYFCALGIVNWLVYGWLPTFLKEHFHLNIGEAGISATGYVQLGSFIGVVCGGLLADKWAKINDRGRIYIVIIGFSVGAPFLFLMASTPIFAIGVIAMIIYGISRGFNDANLMPILCQIVDNKYIATGYGFLNFLSTIVGGVMVYVGGMLKDAHVQLAVVYQVSAILMLIATWTLFAIKLKKQSIIRS